MNSAWGVEMKMWAVDEKPLKANEKQGTGPGGWFTDSAGNSVKWDARGFEIGSAGKGRIIIREDEVGVKLGATALGLSLMSGLTAL